MEKIKTLKHTSKETNACNGEIRSSLFPKWISVHQKLAVLVRGDLNLQFETRTICRRRKIITGKEGIESVTRQSFQIMSYKLFSP